MKKFIFRILLFGAIVCVIDWTYAKTCDFLFKHAVGGDNKAVITTCEEQSADVLIMGSSRARHHYIPSIIADSVGMSVYNAGFDGNGVVLMSGFYNLLSARYRPDLVLYEVTPSFDINIYDEDDGCKRYLKGLRPYFEKESVRKMYRRVAPEDIVKNRFGLYRYNSSIIDLLQDCFFVGQYQPDGFVPMQGVMSAEKQAAKVAGKSEVDTMKLNILYEFVSNVLSDSVQMIFVASPKYGATSSKSFQPIKKLCQEKGIEFWDYYADPQYVSNTRYFKESMHLNEYGAEVFSRDIASRISAYYNKQQL